LASEVRAIIEGRKTQMRRQLIAWRLSDGGTTVERTEDQYIDGGDTLVFCVIDLRTWLAELH